MHNVPVFIIQFLSLYNERDRKGKKITLNIRQIEPLVYSFTYRRNEANAQKYTRKHAESQHKTVRIQCLVLQMFHFALAVEPKGKSTTAKKSIPPDSTLVGFQQRKYVRIDGNVKCQTLCSNLGTRDFCLNRVNQAAHIFLI